MKKLRRRMARGEVVAGTWLNLGSPVTAEIAGRAGFDWVLIDLEHGVGGHEALLHQLQALEGGTALPCVRIEWNDPVRFKRALDLGPAGIMVPYVSSAEEARQAVAAMRYPPRGIRGAARFTRAAGFGVDFDRYFSESGDELLTIIQIETAAALEAVDEIAAVEGVDVLFVGPLDLTISLGIPLDFESKRLRQALTKVVEAAERHDKVVGILLTKPEQIPPMVDLGIRFIALGSDGALVASGMRSYARAMASIHQDADQDADA